MHRAAPLPHQAPAGMGDGAIRADITEESVEFYEACLVSKKSCKKKLGVVVFLSSFAHLCVPRAHTRVHRTCR